MECGKKKLVKWLFETNKTTTHHLSPIYENWRTIFNEDYIYEGVEYR